MRFMKAVLARLKSIEIVVPLAVTLLSVIAAKLLVKNAFTVMIGDAVAYWDMAQVPIDPDMSWAWEGIPGGNVPYTYRIAIPFLVRNLFGSSLAGFFFITVMSLLVCNYLVFRISQIYTTDKRVSSLLVVIFATNVTVFMPLVDVALVDMPSWVTTLLLVYVFLKRIEPGQAAGAAAWAAYGAILMVSALIKEWIFFLLPVLFLHLLYSGRTRKAALLFICSLPAAALHLAIRLIMGPLLPEIQSPSLALLIERYFVEIGAYRAMFSTFGAIWLVLPPAVLFCYKHRREMKETYAPAVLAFAVAVIMGTIASEHSRYLFFISFPFLIPSLSIYFATHSRKFTAPVIYALFALFLAARLAMHYRPVWQEGFSPTGGQGPATILLISVAATIQILVVLYFVAGAHLRTSFSAKPLTT